MRMERIRKILGKYWGYESFLPLQEEAIRSVLEGRDSVVVLPTGGGKSLCYQAPALAMAGTAVVVSPLISLMKDQVDGLRECGVTAGFVNSSQSPAERHEVMREVAAGKVKLLYVAPERLVSPGFLRFAREQKISFVAVDEAHCISMWGHDFRPEYRQLSKLKEAFAGIGVHGYTATATEQVRLDIATQLGLAEPEILVGSFDRKNLIFRVRRRDGLVDQVCSVLKRHAGESGIIYCIRRADVEELAATLVQTGFKARPYHAGMSDEERKENQDAFISEETDIIVATVAFGMGIDKSNVRYVIHAAMPKSPEHYQQEAGRAGRDGLEAECWLFYSGKDFMTWNRLLGDAEPNSKAVWEEKLQAIYGYCTSMTCRHRSIVRYFGQELADRKCDGCDICLGEVDREDDALVMAQKILSCVLRLEERFGGDYTAGVLIGSQEDRVFEKGHDRLSTYGLLSKYSKRVVRDWIEQLVDQGYLRKHGEYNVLRVTPEGWRVLRGSGDPALAKPAKKGQAKKAKALNDSWDGVDEGLFERLRQVRQMLAKERLVPPFVVFSDASLRDMARKRPTTQEGFLQVHGVGQEKCRQYESQFLGAMRKYCGKHGLEMDVGLADLEF